MRRLAVRALVSLGAAPPGKKSSKLAYQVASAEYIYETFGHCQTLDNDNASRYGKYTELQYHESGRLLGTKTLSYYLEKSRLAHAMTGERTFHVLYALAAGATPEEKEILRLGSATDFRYLSSLARSTKDSVQQDAARFQRLKYAFKNVGLSKKQVASICQVLTAVLHLGNIDFTHDRLHAQEAAAVRNAETLQRVASYLGISSRSLEESLTCKTKVIGKEVCTVLLDADGASNNRDDLATFLYEALFSWLNEHLNKKLSNDKFYAFVGLLDIPGLQNISRGNSLDQLVTNFANESQHRFMQRRIFEQRTEEYIHEGINATSSEVSVASNAECVRLFTNQPGGLAHIMNDQARRMPKKTNESMVEAFGKRWGSHSCFKLGPPDRSGATTFAISHFSGPISYTSDQLLERNADAVNPDFATLLRGHPAAKDTATAGTGSSGSTNSFVHSLISTMDLTTQTHPRDAQTIVAMQHSVTPVRAPSTRRPNRSGTLKRAGTAKGRRQTDSDERRSEDEAENENGDLADADPAGEDAKKGKKESCVRCVMGGFRSALNTLFETLEETKAWFVVCLRPNENQLPNHFETRFVKQQIAAYHVPEMTVKLVNEYSVSMTHDEFCERYSALDSMVAVGMQHVTGASEAQQKCHTAKELMNWTPHDAAIGQSKIFLSHMSFRELEDELRAADPDEVHAMQRRALIDADAAARGEIDIFSPDASLQPMDDAFNVTPGGSPYGESPSHMRSMSGFLNAMDDSKSMVTDLSGGAASRNGYHSLTSPSVSASESYAPSRNMFSSNVGKDGIAVPALEETTEVSHFSSTRRRWLFMVWVLTFWVPSPLIKWIGNVRRPDIRLAWREKLAINIVIWLVCACAIFVIAFLGNIICPKEHVYSDSEFQSNSTGSSLTSIRGEVFNLDKIVTMHKTVVPVVASNVILNYAGIDATPIFPVQVNALCNGVSGSVSPWVQLSSTNVTDVYAKYHDFRAVHPEDTRADWYYESMVLMRSNFRVGFMGYTESGLNKLVADGRSVAIYRGEIYDLTDYISQGYRGALQAPAGQQAPANTDTAFMSQPLVQLFSQNAGQDITVKLDALPLSDEVLQRQRVCLRNLYFIGKQDHRNSPQCLFSRYILLALSIVLVSIIGFKFLAALQFGRERQPEDHDKFVLCQVPCYTEGEESMRKTINSLAALKYDDKRKLLFIICDGMIVGSGNDRPTPRIVLDILGSDPNIDPEPLSFLSLGEGCKQHNMAKVYSGLYEYHGHIVPYIVLVKVGKPTERHRPGNRGKRDSQLVLMRFFNKVHFGLPMNPMELELYHQIKNVIGVNPSFYEYLMQVDADTEAEDLCLNRFISAFIRDKKVIGMCGETSLSNSKRTIITMLQVYEYFISHYLTKAFESLFGSVTCLPGCFSVFRLRTPDTHKPLFIANAVVEEYAENRVDTLHTKNLLHLGEDRYLTTLVLKHFGNYKTTFIRDAKARTAAPEDWSVLLSQRRRWINSTLHNYFELLKTPGLCGFCLFSMRFVVFIDLLSTVVAPVTIIYIIYLIVLVSTSDATIPLTAILMLAAIYGLQAVLFLLRRRFDMIIWMLIYIVGLPIWTFFLPLYSFWHMDDFSWGSTRVVMGEKGQKIIMHDEGTFDPLEIPQQTWRDYEEELWERNSARSIGSLIAENQAQTAGSMYGFDGKDEKYAAAGSHAGSMYAPSLYGASPMQPRGSQSVRRLSTSASSMLGGIGTGNSYVGYQPPAAQDAAYPSSPTYSRKASMYSLGAGSIMMPPPASSAYDPPAHASYGMTTSLSMPTPFSSMYGGLGAPYSSPPMATQQTHVSANGSPSSYSRAHSPIPRLDMPLVDTTPLSVGTGQLPGDEVIARDIHAIVTTSDLTTVTKKTIRAQLEAKYGISVAPKRAFVNETVDKILASM